MPRWRKQRFFSKLQAILGWLAILLPLTIYAVAFIPQRVKPGTLNWIQETLGTSGLIIVNGLIVVAFFTLLPYRRSTKNEWKACGTFSAFLIALMTEMFGWPLVLFILSPMFNIPKITPQYFQTIGHWPAMLGTLICFFGIVLIVSSWKQIHRANVLVTKGVYSYIRHPQYTGIFLFTLGWIMHWPSIITIALWPILIAAYSWLAIFEEKQAINQYENLYLKYMVYTRRFITFVI